jgi:hypothetical protein
MSDESPPRVSIVQLRQRVKAKKRRTKASIFVDDADRIYFLIYMFRQRKLRVTTAKLLRYALRLVGQHIDSAKQEDFDQ